MYKRYVVINGKTESLPQFTELSAAMVYAQRVSRRWAVVADVYSIKFNELMYSAYPK